MTKLTFPFTENSGAQLNEIELERITGIERDTEGNGTWFYYDLKPDEENVMLHVNADFPDVVMAVAAEMARSDSMVGPHTVAPFTPEDVKRLIERQKAQAKQHGRP